MGRYGEVVTSLNLSLICQNPPESPHEDAGILSTYFVSGQDSSCPKNRKWPRKIHWLDRVPCLSQLSYP